MAPTSHSLIFSDDFKSGIDTVERWPLIGDDSYRADDGVPVVSASGLSVAPGARNAHTGQPRFSNTSPGQFAHLKWLAATGQSFAPTGVTRFAFRAGAECFGVADHPYGDTVADPDRDLRLGAATLNVLDFATGLVFDLWICNAAIYPFYERIKFPGDPRGYQAFTSVGRPVPRRPADTHDLAIIFDASTQSVTWEVDGDVVGEVAEVGAPHPNWTLILNHGGTPERATAQSFQVGLGLLTLLDATWPPSSEALVDEGLPQDPAPRFRGGPSLFGQGAELRIESVTVERLPS